MKQENEGTRRGGEVVLVGVLSSVGGLLSVLTIMLTVMNYASRDGGRRIVGGELIVCCSRAKTAGRITRRFTGLLSTSALNVSIRRPCGNACRRAVAHYLGRGTTGRLPGLGRLGIGVTSCSAVFLNCPV